jgi:hypothetical protein
MPVAGEIWTGSNGEHPGLPFRKFPTSTDPEVCGYASDDHDPPATTGNQKSICSGTPA